MPSAGEPRVTPALRAQAQGSDSIRRTPVRIVRAANDNHRTHSLWRRFVAASMATLFAASLILVGLVCIANAGERTATVFDSN